MPPRTVKRGGAAKRAKAALENNDNNNKQQEPETAEPFVNQEYEENAVNEEKNGVVGEKPDNGKNNEEEVKESKDGYEKDEHLNFEDNYPEYEPLEFGGDDYDESEDEPDEGQEVGDEVDEEQEGNVGEEEADTGDEEVEYVYEEVEVDEDDEHADDEHDPAQMGDVEEEKSSEFIKERQKQREYEVFVGGLDKNATEDDLRKVFGEVGVITEVRLVLNPHTKKNRGFAFLRFETVEQAKRAVAELKNSVINGKQCRISPVHHDNDTLYLGNICKTWKKEALKDKLKHYGVENVENLTLVEDSSNEGMNRGFAFLEFPSRSEAKKAYKQLHKRDVMFGVDKPAEVSFTNSVIDPVDEILAQVKTVFIDSLPPSWDEDYVRDLLKKFGEIEKIELARNMPAARRKNYGFVTFSTHEAAVECADSITSAGLGEGDKKEKVRARLSRPLGKGSRKHVSNGAYRSVRNSGKSAKPSRSRLAPRSLPAHMVKGSGRRVPPARPVRVRNRRPAMSMSVRVRPVAHSARSSDKRSTAPGYLKSSMKRDFGRREDLPPPRSRVSIDYGSRVASQRHPSYRDYPAQASGYSELHKNASRAAAAAAPRRGYVDDDYAARFERPPPSSHLSHREVRSRDYDSLSGSKRPYAVVDDVLPGYSDTGARQSRSRMDYEYGGSTSHYGDAYGNRHGRPSLGYNGSRSSISIHDFHGMYGSQQSVSYSRGSFGGSDDGLYSSSYGADYISRGRDVGGRLYSSIYSGRGVGSSNSYMSGGRSGSYY